MELDLKIFRMNRLGIPQERIAKRLGQTRDTIRDHLGKMPGLAKSPKADLSKGFTVAQVAEKHGWPIFQAPLSSERFKANVVSAMQKRKIIGVTSLGGYDICSSRYVIISKKKPNQD